MNILALGWGLMAFFAGSLISTTISTVQQRIVAEIGHVGMVDQGFRLCSLYAGIISSIIAYYCMFQGGSRLLQSIAMRSPVRTRILMISGIVSGTILLSMLVFSNPYRTVSTVADIRPLYGVSDGLIVLTVLIPYTVMWLFGGLAVVYLNTYGHKVKGLLYRIAARYIVRGISLVLGLSIVLQMISQFGDYWAHVGLKAILIIVYVLLLIILAGYVYIARGARKLQSLEDLPLSK